LVVVWLMLVVGFSLIKLSTYQTVQKHKTVINCTTYDQ